MSIWVEYETRRSNAVKWIAYNAAERKLAVLWRSNPSVYVYENVSKEEYQALLHSRSIGGSIGRTMNTIKNEHDYVKFDNMDQFQKSIKQLEEENKPRKNKWEILLEKFI